MDYTNKINKELLKLNIKSSIINEGKDNEKITRILLIDFDQTLINTGTPEDIKRIWFEKKGTPWPHKGIWSQNDSLDMDVFDFPAIEPTLSIVKQNYGIEGTKVFLLTGRLPKNGPFVEKIINSYGLKFDDYFYKTGHETLYFKLKKMSELLEEYPDTEEVTLLEDRIEHFDAFEAWGKQQKNIKFKLYRIG